MIRAKVALSGYYGFNNAGDEAVLAGLVRGLRAHGDEIEITALSINPEETAASHGIAAAHRYQPAALIRTLSHAPLLLSGGGSLLQDVTSGHGIFYYLGVLRAAQILGKKTMLIAQGIGPLIRPRSRRFVAAVANRANAITLRDRDSAALLRTIGVTQPTVEITADPALLLTPTQEHDPEAARHFAVALRPWPISTGTVSDLLAEACRSSLEFATPIAIAMQPHADHSVTEQFLKKLHQRGGRAASPSCRVSEQSPHIPLQELTDRFADSEMTIGMRLHALILAAACGVPSVGISYDPKVTAFMTETGQGDAVFDLSVPDIGRLEKMIARVWLEREERAVQLQRRLPALRAAAQRNADIALSLLK